MTLENKSNRPIRRSPFNNPNQHPAVYFVPDAILLYFGISQSTANGENILLMGGIAYTLGIFVMIIEREIKHIRAKKLHASQLPETVTTKLLQLDKSIDK